MYHRVSSCIMNPVFVSLFNHHRKSTRIKLWCQTRKEKFKLTQFIGLLFIGKIVHRTRLLIRVPFEGNTVSITILSLWWRILLYSPRFDESKDARVTANAFTCVYLY